MDRDDRRAVESMSGGMEFTLPDLGEGLTEAEVVRWLVEVGDEIAVDQPVAEVETAKAAVEVPCPYAGTVTELHGAVGDVIEVGRPLITVGGPAGDAAQAGPDTRAGEARTGEARADEDTDSPGTAESGDQAGSGNVLVGYGTGHLTDATGGGRPSAAGPPAANGTQAGAPAGGLRRTAVVSPLVRRLARERGIDVTTLRGSGPRGLVLRSDVPATAQPRRPEPVPDGATGNERRIPLRGARRTMAESVTRSRREIPEATVWVDADATEFVAARAQINAADPNRPVSLTALLGRFCVLALWRYPLLNARVDGQEIVLNDAVHLGFAAQTDGGLVVPVVHDADRMPTRRLAERMRELTATARAGELSPAELTGGTCTVNNYGVFGVDGSAAIINAPQVAIVGIGRIVQRPWVVDDTLTVRRVTELTLAFDHRVCDGETAGGFLRYLADCVEHPISALGDL